MSAAEVPLTQEYFIHLYEANLLPLRVVLAGLVWVLHDYFVTLEDEIRYVWKQRRSFSKFMFLWIRYYTIFLLAFDTLQIHSFTIPGVATDTMCVIAAPVTRIVGAISLWSVEINMQLRVYALFNCSKKVAMFNLALFMASIGVFLWILIDNSLGRGERIAAAVHLPLPGCPAINGGTEWALWIPPTVFEVMLFLFVFYKAATSISAQMTLNQRVSLIGVIIQENTLYFFSIACLLIFNNLMVIGATRIPWFGFAPFHAAMGIVTCRTLIHLRKFSVHQLGEPGRTTNPDSTPLTSLDFGPESPKPSCSMDLDLDTDISEMPPSGMDRDVEYGIGINEPDAEFSYPPCCPSIMPHT